MKSKYFVALIVCLCVVAPLTLSANGSQDGGTEPITISMSWWGGESRHKGTIAAIELWNNTHENIQVEYAYSGWDSYHDKLTTQFVGRVAPDVIQIDRSYLEKFADSGVLLDLTEQVPTQFGGLDEGLLPYGEVDGKTYALPTGSTGIGLIFSRQRYADLGLREPSENETWDSFLELCKEATRDLDGDGDIDVWGTFNPFHMSAEALGNVFHQYGLELWKDDMQGSNFDDPRALEIFNMMYEFVEAGVCPSGEVAEPEGMGWVNSGICASRIGPLSRFAGSQSVVDFEMDCTVIPRKTANGSTGTSLTPPMVFGISSETEYSDEAIEFLSWFLTDVEAATASGMIRGMYPSAQVRSALEPNMTPEDVKVARAMNVVSAEEAVYNVDMPEGAGEWEDIYIVEVEKLIYGQVSVEECIENVIKNADPVLRD